MEKLRKTIIEFNGIAKNRKQYRKRCLNLPVSWAVCMDEKDNGNHVFYLRPSFELDEDEKAKLLENGYFLYQDGVFPQLDVEKERIDQKKAELISNYEREQDDQRVQQRLNETITCIPENWIPKCYFVDPPTYFFIPPADEPHWRQIVNVLEKRGYEACQNGVLPLTPEENDRAQVLKKRIDELCAPIREQLFSTAEIALKSLTHQYSDRVNFSIHIDVKTHTFLLEHICGFYGTRDIIDRKYGFNLTRDNLKSTNEYVVFSGYLDTETFLKATQ